MRQSGACECTECVWSAERERMHAHAPRQRFYLPSQAASRLRLAKETPAQGTAIRGSGRHPAAQVAGRPNGCGRPAWLTACPLVHLTTPLHLGSLSPVTASVRNSHWHSDEAWPRPAAAAVRGSRCLPLIRAAAARCKRLHHRPTHPSFPWATGSVAGPADTRREACCANGPRPFFGFESDFSTALCLRPIADHLPDEARNLTRARRARGGPLFPSTHCTVTRGLMARYPLGSKGTSAAPPSTARVYTQAHAHAHSGS